MGGPFGFAKLTSYNPLRGTLLLITDDDDEVELQLDKEPPRHC
ncbi:hypothetical protein [Mesorhizobium sp. WSM1293]|nr:hypothetical protein [Mesorhizobium sp. WSM1293]